MKKVILIAIAVASLSISALSQRKMMEISSLVFLSNPQDDKIQIKKNELPEAARKTLDGDAFKGWSITTAYKLKNGDYEVELRKGDTTQTLKFDKDGKVK